MKALPSSVTQSIYHLDKRKPEPFFIKLPPGHSFPFISELLSSTLKVVKVSTVKHHPPTVERQPPCAITKRVFEGLRPPGVAGCVRRRRIFNAGRTGRRRRQLSADSQKAVKATGL